MEENLNYWVLKKFKSYHDNKSVLISNFNYTSVVCGEQMDKYTLS